MSTRLPRTIVTHRPKTLIRLGLGLLAGPGLVSFTAVRILDRYIVAEWAKVFALALLSFVGLMLLSDGYNRIPEFLDLGAGWGTIVAYLLLGLVRNLSLLIPISLLRRRYRDVAPDGPALGCWPLPGWATGPP
jgi:hypothetical protein